MPSFFHPSIRNFDAFHFPRVMFVFGRQEQRRQHGQQDDSGA
jgi:hypothetical protein